MQKNSGDFSMEDALQFANSPTGKQLLSLLRNADNSALQTAIRQASDGNYRQAKDTLSAILDGEKIQKILKSEGE